MLTTVSRMTQYLGLTDVTDNAPLLEALAAAEAQMERYAGRWLMPRLASLRHSVVADAPESLILAQDLITLHDLTSDDGTSIHPSMVDVVTPGLLRLLDGQSFTWADTPQNAITVTGIWAWHEVLQSVWAEVSTVANPVLGATGKTLTVPDSTGFAAGQLLRIEEEFLLVTNVIDATTLTVQRGMNGTTPIAHMNGVFIDVFSPSADLAQLATRWAAWVYRQPDYADGEAPPAEFMEALRSFRRFSVLDV